MMKNLVRSTVVLATLACVLAISASAGGHKQVIPNPASACKALIGAGAGGYSSFSQCVTTIGSDVAAYRFPSDEDPNVLLSLDQRCAQFEAGVYDPESGMTFAFTYPGFYLDEGPFWPFVTFTINNHAQCELALFTYHALAGAE